jgi:hemolysin activation/secretion protein
MRLECCWKHILSVWLLVACVGKSILAAEVTVVPLPDAVATEEAAASAQTNPAPPDPVQAEPVQAVSDVPQPEADSAKSETNRAKPEPEAAKDEPRFDILEYQVEGSTVLSALEIERAVYPHLGYGKSMANVEAARISLERAFQESGYLTVSVDIPEQDVDKGIVRLRVNEGKIGRVRVTGSRYYELGKIKDKAADLKPGTVPYFPSVQKQLAGLNRTEDRRVTPSFKPSRSPGKVDVELKVEDKAPFHAGIELNDRYSANTKRLRLNGFIRYENLFQRDHSITLNYQTAPEKPSQVQVFSGTYLLPIPKSENLLALYAVRSNTDVAAIGTAGVVGTGTIFGLRLIRPLRGWQGFYHSLTLGIDYKRFGETIKLLGNDTLNRPISYAPFLVQYGATTQDSNGQTQYGVSGHFALRRLLGNSQEEFALKRERADANYFYLRGEVSRLQNLPKDWSIFAKLDGQWTKDVLISNEQYSAGGADSIRGYLESESFGDFGMRASLEGRSPFLGNFLPFLSDERKKIFDEFYGLAFVEYASLKVKDAAVDEESKFELASAGLGLRIKAWKKLNFALDLAYPLKDAANTKKGDVRTHFNLGYEY